MSKEGLSVQEALIVIVALDNQIHLTRQQRDVRTRARSVLYNEALRIAEEKGE